MVTEGWHLHSSALAYGQMAQTCWGALGGTGGHSGMPTPVTIIIS